MSKVYNFDEQKKKGTKYELELDAHARSWGIDITLATIEQQYLGIDRIFHMEEADITVEYKADMIGHKTGNVFVEVMVSQRPGWALKSEADYLLYYFPDHEKKLALWCPMWMVKNNIPTWAQECEEREVECDIGDLRVVTRGLLVDINKFRQDTGATKFSVGEGGFVV